VPVKESFGVLAYLLDYYFKPSAVRDLRRLPKNAQKRIIRKLNFFTKSDEPLGFAETIKDKALGGYRFRIGDYRAIFDLVGDKIVVLAVGHRKDIYN